MSHTIFVTKPLLPSFEDYIEEIRDIWADAMVTNMGKKHDLLQRGLESYLKVENLELMVNGHGALEGALQSLFRKGEVITTPFTFVSTTHAIVRSGCTPVFCDITPDDFTIDVSKVEDLITEKTVAILPVHVYGNLCDVDILEAIGKKHDLPVIYDAAHAFGVEKNGKGAGSFGTMSCFSFHATKVFNTIEGGGICVNEPVYREAVQARRNFGMIEGEVVQDGGNFKMHEFSAAMGLCNLKLMESAFAQRKKVFSWYQEVLSGKGLQMLVPQKNVASNYAYFPVVVEKEDCGFTRAELMEGLAHEDIVGRQYFYPLTSGVSCYRGKFWGETPVAERIAQGVLCLPIYPGMEQEVVGRVFRVVDRLQNGRTL